MSQVCFAASLPSLRRPARRCATMSATRARVASLGLLCVDLVGTVSAYPQPDAKIRTTSFAEHGGGNGANAASAAARLGAQVSLISVVGDDARGVVACEALRKDGVDVSHVRVARDGCTPFSYVIVDSGAGTRTCIHTAGRGDVEMSEDARAAVRKADVLMLDGRYAGAAVEAAGEMRKTGGFVMLDAEREREGTVELLSLVDGAVVKDVLVEALVGADVSRMLRYGMQWVVVTRGKEGCVLVRKKGEHFMESEALLCGLRLSTQITSVDGLDVEMVSCEAVRDVNVVDATGAGDAFFGALAYAVATGIGVERGIVLACIVGAKSCGGEGARSAAWSYQIEHVMREILRRETAH